ncbi:hypothetical protein CEXT_812341 [Caerostris extrusa]|uniref:Uncharacterized protein n=1 Tax=Caerostris extrusa TaxID=172846 RepID=A0AAV4NCQ1_CAEEX|nr:hypothetical protein CEXT_812341 [Caerostris extrusa]
MCRDITKIWSKCTRIPLMCSCFSGSIDCTKLLLKMGADVHAPQGQTTSLHIACQEDKVECAELLIKYGANINALNQNRATPFCIIAFSMEVHSAQNYF